MPKQPMKIPTSVRVSAFDIEIVEFTVHDGVDLERLGEFSAVQQRIRVDESLKPQKRLDTVLHEVNHAVYWAYNLDDDDEEERIVSTFATAWAQIYRDNPAFLQWVNETVEQANKMNGNAPNT